MTVDADRGFMARALALAGAQQGRTAPNPAVGCVLVRDGVVIAEAATGDGGRPHAEEAALALIGGRAEGAVAYVTLEPCGGRSSGAAGCSERLIAAGVSRVVCAIADPHPQGAGGFAKLEEAGVPVLVGVGEAEALGLYEAFFHRVATGSALGYLADEATGFEAELTLEPGEALAAALQRLGAAGFSRVFARPDSAAASALRQAQPHRF